MKSVARRTPNWVLCLAILPAALRLPHWIGEYEKKRTSSKHIYLQGRCKIGSTVQQATAQSDYPIHEKNSLKIQFIPSSLFFLVFRVLIKHAKTRAHMHTSTQGHVHAAAEEEGTERTSSTAAIRGTHPPGWWWMWIGRRT